MLLRTLAGRIEPIILIAITEYQLLGFWGVPTPRFAGVVDFIHKSLDILKSRLGGVRIWFGIIHQVWRARNAKKHGRSFGTPSIIAAAALESVDIRFDSPQLEHWNVNLPFGQSSSSWRPPLLVGLSSISMAHSIVADLRVWEFW